MAWLPLGASDQDGDAPACGAPPERGVGRYQRLESVAAQSVWSRQWALCSGARSGATGCHGGTPEGMCQPVRNSSTRLPSWPAAPRWAPSMAAAIPSHVAESPEWPKGAEAERGAGSLGGPRSPPPASLRNPSGPRKNDEERGGQWDVPMPLTCWVTLGKSLPPSWPQFPLLRSLMTPIGTSLG